jgi:hypothetical protein
MYKIYVEINAGVENVIISNKYIVPYSIYVNIVCKIHIVDLHSHVYEPTTSHLRDRGDVLYSGRLKYNVLKKAFTSNVNTSYIGTYRHIRL